MLEMRAAGEGLPLPFTSPTVLGRLSHMARRANACRNKKDNGSLAKRSAVPKPQRHNPRSKEILVLDLFREGASGCFSVHEKAILVCRRSIGTVCCTSVKELTFFFEHDCYLVFLNYQP